MLHFISWRLTCSNCFRSCVLSVKRRYSSSHPALNRSMNTTKCLTSTDLQNKTRIREPNEKTETNVIYVFKTDAKKVKVALESLKYLDSRFKMISVDTNLVALPVTLECLSYMQQKKAGQYGQQFEDLVVRIGRESVPLSSSSMGKLKQRR